MTQRTQLTAGLAEDAAVQLVHDFSAIVREEIGMREDLAELFSEALVRGLRRRLGGRDLYVPAPDRAKRDAAIREEFTGSNLETLMRRHGLSRTRIYEIVGSRSGRSAT